MDNPRHPRTELQILASLWRAETTDDMDRPARLQMAATAHPQESSRLMRKLPVEVRRMIFQEAWRDAGLAQHILMTKSSTKLYHSPCVSKGAADETTDEQLQKAETPEEAVEVLRRAKSSWALHWACEDDFIARQDGTTARWSPFLPILLTCKLFYLEAVDSIYQDVTFCMTSPMIAVSFLNRYPLSTFRSINICVQMPPLMSDLYLSPGKHTFQVGNTQITAQDNPWERLLRTLSRMTNLRELDLWVTTMNNIRPWHDCAWEKKIFAGLFDVRASRKYVVNLPKLPSRPPKTGHEDWYLTDEDLAKAPFTLVRGGRPDQWRVHMFLRGIWRSRPHWQASVPPQKLLERARQWHHQRLRG